MRFRLSRARSGALRPEGHTPGRSLLCVISLFALASWAFLYGQSADSRSAEIISGAGTYTLEWRRHYQLQTGLVQEGIAADNGALWLITGAGPGKPEGSVTKIGPDGQLLASYDPLIPLKPLGWVGSLALAVSGQSVGLLASLVSGGREQIFEGAFFSRVGAGGLGNPVRIASPGPQFLTMTGTGTGEFIAAGDQEPLTLVKLDAGGKVLWRRTFSPKLVLPTVSVGSSGDIFVLSQEGSDILLQVLNSSGFVLRSKRIAAKQGVVVADPNGDCSLLFTTRFGGKDNKVYLMALDRDLNQLDRVETPLVGWGGRTYQLISSPHGHLIIGEGPEPNPRNKKILAGYDSSGALIWQQSISSSVQLPLLCPFRSGFYLVRGLAEGEGSDVEKYIY